jgi:hypothetical protein
VVYGKGEAILWICIVAWLLCFLFYLGAILTIEHDIRVLRSQMADRAAQTKDLKNGEISNLVPD